MIGGWIRTVAAIASTTYREAARQPVLWVLVCVFGGLIGVSGEITLFSLGDEQGMLREMGLSSIALAGLLIVLILATNLIQAEIEGRTIQTLLTRPVGRGQVLLGKYLGICAAVGGSMLLLSFVLVLVLWAHGGRDDIRDHERRERWRERTEWSAHKSRVAPDRAMTSDEIRAGEREIAGGRLDLQGYLQVVKERFAPGLLPLAQGVLLAFLQALVLAAFSTVLSVRFRLLQNAIFTFLLFTLGHLSPYLHERMTAEGVSGWLRWAGEILYRLLPNLESYNLATVFARTDGSIPASYIALAALSAGLYSAALLAIGLWVFRSAEVAGRSAG